VYRLKYGPGLVAFQDSLPPEISLELTLALADVCKDPVAHTKPYGEDDGVMRRLITPHLLAAVLIGRIPPMAVLVLDIQRLG